MLSPAHKHNRRGCCFSFSGEANGRCSDTPRVALEGGLLVGVQQDCGIIRGTANLVSGEKVVLRDGAGCRLVALVFRRSWVTTTCGAERSADRCEE